MSERGLTERILERLPADAALMADRNFAVFPVAWAERQHNFGVPFRITGERARKIAGHCWPPAGRERRIEWRPSPHDRRAHPALPADAVGRGRLIVAHVEGEDGKRIKLYPFTTLEEPLEVLVELYRQRLAHRVGHSFPEADAATAQLAFKDAGDGGKGTVARHRRLQPGA